MSNAGSRGLGLFMTVGLVGAAFTFLVVVLESSQNMDNPMPLVVLAVGAVMFAGLVRSPIGKAIARMLEGHDQLPDDQVVMRVEDLEARLQELSLEQSRVMELESRLDFAERMLTSESRGGPNGTTQ